MEEGETMWVYPDKGEKQDINKEQNKFQVPKPSLTPPLSPNQFCFQKKIWRVFFLFFSSTWEILYAIHWLLRVHFRRKNSSTNRKETVYLTHYKCVANEKPKANIESNLNASHLANDIWKSTSTIAVLTIKWHSSNVYLSWLVSFGSIKIDLFKD